MSEKAQLLPAYSVVVPVYNSSAMLGELVNRLHNTLQKMGEKFEVIMVEDCSPDDSWSQLTAIAKQYPEVTAIQLMHNSGQGIATLCGCAHAKGQIIITIDDDLQYLPEEIPLLIKQLKSNDGIDVVMGISPERQHSLYRNLGSAFINSLNSIFLKKPHSLRFSSFRAMDRKVVEGLSTLHLPYPALGPMLLNITKRIVNIDVSHKPRPSGRSGYNFSKLLRQTLANIIGYSMLPLHILAVVGFIGILCSASLGAYYLGRYLFVGISISGWTSLILTTIALAGFNFFAFAMLGEYIKRIFYLQSHTQKYLIRSIV